MRIRLALTLAAVTALAISLPRPAAAMVLVEAPGASDGTSGGTGVAPPAGPGTSPTAPLSYGTIGGKSFDPGPRDWVEYSELRNKFTKNVQHNAPAWDGRWITVLP